MKQFVYVFVKNYKHDGAKFLRYVRQLSADGIYANGQSWSINRIFINL
jgi:hypothetical protein